MKPSLERILIDVKRFHKGCQSKLVYASYKNKIDRSIAPDEQKKVAVLQVALIMEVKPE